LGQKRTGQFSRTGGKRVKRYPERARTLNSANTRLGQGTSSRKYIPGGVKRERECRGEREGQKKKTDSSEGQSCSGRHATINDGKKVGIEGVNRNKEATRRGEIFERCSSGTKTKF